MSVLITKYLEKKPEHCADCPICSEYDECLLQPVWYKTWEEQYEHCPLEDEK